MTALQLDIPDWKLIHIDDDGWMTAPFVARIPGPPEKQYTQRNSETGEALHSVVGQERDYQDGIPNRFLDVRRDAQGRFIEAASCQRIIRKFPTLFPGFATCIQMYPFGTSTWTSGGREGNTTFGPTELEGGGYLLDGSPNFGEAISLLQTRTAVAIWLAKEAWMQRKLHQLSFRYHYGFNMLQHKDIARKFGYNATSCASDRWDNAIAALERARRLPVPDTALTEKIEAVEASVALYNEILVIGRDVQRAVNGRHPSVWRIHKALREAGLLVEPEYQGDYREYAP